MLQVYNPISYLKHNSMMHLDYKITEEALSAMWGVKVTYAKAGEECVRLTPLNLHYEGVPLHDDIDGILPSFPVPHDKASPLSISLDLIDPRYDYDFTFIKDMDTFQRGTAVYLSLIHICRCRRIERCRSRWSPYH
eukprot:TRINITY_DN6597_c0_g1_i4.p2 TRINITY_DN6597_c0_g1~~TRINITY_DN6597_c0_g1_i4.p2  ORF type:complete len:136 (+),score=32.77 TRINITY_DN6597_c0_g1_i4:110-517(+)